MEVREEHNLHVPAVHKQHVPAGFLKIQIKLTLQKYKVLQKKEGYVPVTE